MHGADDTGQSLSIYVEKYSGIISPSHILKEGIKIENAEGKSIYDVLHVKATPVK